MKIRKVQFELPEDKDTCQRKPQRIPAKLTMVAYFHKQHTSSQYNTLTPVTRCNLSSDFSFQGTPCLSLLSLWKCKLKQQLKNIAVIFVSVNPSLKGCQLGTVFVVTKGVPPPRVSTECISSSQKHYFKFLFSTSK